jgi:NADP-dependent 3-hydroxy acid dehydrogenase YdfG
MLRADPPVFLTLAKSHAKICELLRILPRAAAVLTDERQSTKEKLMNIENKTVLITGANRGIGLALVNEALRRGPKRVYAGTRGPLQVTDERVTPLTLDVTSVSQIQTAANEIDSLDVLINNAGIAIYDDLSDVNVIEKHLAVNFLG